MSTRVGTPGHLGPPPRPQPRFCPSLCLGFPMDVSHLLLFVSLLYFVTVSRNGRGLVPSIWHTKCHPCALHTVALALYQLKAAGEEDPAKDMGCE